MSKDDLHARLDALASEINDARKEFETHERWNDGHDRLPDPAGQRPQPEAQSEQQEARYRYLKSQIDGEVKDLKAHGERVSDLEFSVRKWLDGLSLRSE